MTIKRYFETLFGDWLKNTIIFIFQIMAGTAAYAITKDVIIAFAVSAFIIMVGMSKPSYIEEASKIAFWSTVLAAVAIYNPQDLSLACILAIVALVLWSAEKAWDNESFWSTFIVRFPFGVGTIFGGAILLHRWRQQRRLSSVE